MRLWGNLGIFWGIAGYACVEGLQTLRPGGLRCADCRQRTRRDSSREGMMGFSLTFFTTGKTQGFALSSR